MLLMNLYKNNQISIKSAQDSGFLYYYYIYLGSSYCFPFGFKGGSS